MSQLTEANEHLALRAAKVSEAELQEVQQEAAQRLAAAERKVRVQQEHAARVAFCWSVVWWWDGELWQPHRAP